MIKEYYVVTTETFTVTYLVEAENEEQAEEKVENGDADHEIANTPEEMSVLSIKEESKWPKSTLLLA